MSTGWIYKPTQELILAVLVARHRLGEHLWTFDSRVLGSAQELEALGLVNLMHGVVEHTFRASLTDTGLKEQLDPNYRTPEGRQLDKLKVEREVLWLRVAELEGERAELRMQLARQQAAPHGGRDPEAAD